VPGKICRVLPSKLPQVVDLPRERYVGAGKVKVLEMSVRMTGEAMYIASRVAVEANDKTLQVDVIGQGLHGNRGRIQWL